MSDTPMTRDPFLHHRIGEANVHLSERVGWERRIESLEKENERLRAAIRDAAECADSDIQDMLLEALEHQGGAA